MFHESTAVFLSCSLRFAGLELSVPSHRPAATGAPKQIAKIVAACANPTRMLHHPAATSTAVIE
jgi:hypothetical protein